MSQAPRLDDPVSRLRGVGPARAAQLARLGIGTVLDLLSHRPRRHEDRRKLAAIQGLAVGELAVVQGVVVECGLKTFPKRNKSQFVLVLDDETGRLHCRWWNMPFLARQYRVGQRLLVVGRVKEERPFAMEHPDVEPLGEGPPSKADVGVIVPIYPLTEGLTQRALRRVVHEALDSKPVIHSPHDPLPDGRPSLAEAYRHLHFPGGDKDADAARERLALEEFIDMQAAMQGRRRRFEAAAPALVCSGDNRLVRPFAQALPFKFTAAQTRVLREIRADLAGAHPMRRLLQGDVGSGKTVVAACAALMVVESGHQVAVMAPTEILAEQHARLFEGWLGPLGVGVRQVTGSTQARARAGRTPGSSAELFVGTQALLEDSVQMERLGLVVIDEQHRFGVAQRERLLRKGRFPHLLVMTATPIPRTLGLTLYGDLDTSLLDELPPGRKPVRTFLRPAASMPKVAEFVRSKLELGQQACFVYPRVEEDEAREVRTVRREAELLSALLAPFPVAGIHGKLKSSERSRVMGLFASGEVKVLAASSLIEVGVDVPNATVMVVANAEYFGLAQLHQLRGRVGRGAAESYCVFLSDPGNEKAWERLQVLESTTDGFAIAEADLRLRGPGELLGREQSGMPSLKFGDLVNDLPLIHQARALASSFLDRSSGRLPDEVPEAGLQEPPAAEASAKQRGPRRENS